MRLASRGEPLEASLFPFLSLDFITSYLPGIQMNYLQIEELNANGNEELNANGNRGITLVRNSQLFLERFP